MVQAEGMGLAPWGVLGGGMFKSEEEFKTQEGRQMGGPSETDKKVSKVLESIAKKKGTIMTSVVSTLPSRFQTAQPPPLASSLAMQYTNHASQTLAT